MIDGAENGAPRRLARICVYCGSRRGNRAGYRKAATEVGRFLAKREIELVYGGGSVGLMGVLADAVLQSGGSVVGVIPEFLAVKELLHPGISDMRLVPDMHARKALMADLADAFIALPGGFGTFEELFETMTWSQLGLHAKPIGLLNVDGFFDHLLAFLDLGFAEGFLKPVDRELFHVEEEVERLLDRLATHQPPRMPRWLPEEGT